MISTSGSDSVGAGVTRIMLEFMTLKRLDLHHLNLDFLVLMLAICFMSGTKPVCASNDEPAEYNRRATATAQILAGITPNPADPALKRLVASRIACLFFSSTSDGLIAASLLMPRI